MGKKNVLPDADSKDEQRLPLAQEQAQVTTQRVVDSRIKITRSTTSAEELLETELLHEEIEIEHININQLLEDDDIPDVRQEGDVLIIPVIEEQVEIIRRRVLKEEIHIHKLKKKEPFQQKVVLRRQEVKINKDNSQS